MHENPHPHSLTGDALAASQASLAHTRWVDTHNHLDAREFDDDREAVANRASAAGVAMVVIPAVAVGNFTTVRALAHAQGAAYALGIHPMCVPDASLDDLDRLREAVALHRSDPRLVAVGEIGIDGMHPACIAPGMLDKQRHFMIEQLKVARDAGLPVIAHVRRGVDAVLASLRRVRVAGGIAHAYNGSAAQAAAFAGLGFKLGFGGAMTYERALHLRELANTLPQEAIVMETDSPDIPPQWLYRTRAERDAGATMRNEACELPAIGAAMALLRGVSTFEWAAISTHNACAALPKLSALLIHSGAANAVPVRHDGAANAVPER